MPPPIQLLDYVPERIDFDVNPAYRSDPEQAEEVAQDGRPAVSIDVDWSTPAVPEDQEEVADDDHPDEILYCTLTVYLNEEEFTENHAYYANLRLAGLFQRTAPEALFETEEEAEDYDVRTLSACISMLYGTARSEIASMTSQAPYGKFLLPSVSPAQAAQSVLEGNDDTETSRGEE